MARLLNVSDSKVDPEGFESSPATACLQSVAAIGLTMSASVFAIITDADGWVGGTIINSPTTASGTGGFVIDEAAGTIKCTRAMRIRVKYMISGITVINGAVREAAVFGGTAGTTRRGGTSFGTDLTAAPSTLVGEVTYLCVVGELISIKAIESTAGTMTIAATGATFIVEEV